MSPDIPGLVQTSTNLGVIAPEGRHRRDAVLLTRSAIDSLQERPRRPRIAAICRLAGFQAQDPVATPAGSPSPSSPVVASRQAMHQKVFGKPMEIKAIHAGLECGLIGENYPTVEMASIGPSMWDVHTPDEHVSIPSAGRFWDLLKEILARVPNA